MTLKDLLRKKDRVRADDTVPSHHGGLAPPSTAPEVSRITFMRTTTNTQERISPPAYPGDNEKPPRLLPVPGRQDENQKRLSIFRRPSQLAPDGRGAARNDKRLSERLHLSRPRANSSLVNLPSNLPAITVEVARSTEEQAEWEKRATALAKGTLISKGDGLGREAARSPSPSVSDEPGDNNIQEAIRLHESGDLERSTEMFSKLADPNGANNALSQVLYGLALRHGWGCQPNQELAVTYLSLAAANSAEIESLALAAGMKKGGAAKGELVLAMFELANSFRHGWGVKKDPAAARQYYETAANLGDTDAMNEAAWCYLDGFGGKKDKFKAAQFLRLAEEKGNKTIGNSWIWKEKYNPK
ncbi:hypothetical protein IWX49DRAFT_331562 [Phyllosticta citricarpa]|uniref:HCP-like protein n=1 Tax=Phyllosticta paracitricarpa TaxID=2016321 RepID=A0ABR1MTC4_9PEZI